METTTRAVVSVSHQTTSTAPSGGLQCEPNLGGWRNTTSYGGGSHEVIGGSSDGHAPYCPQVFDAFLCWPATKEGERVYLPCPDGVRGLDPESKSKTTRTNRGKMVLQIGFATTSNT